MSTSFDKILRKKSDEALKKILINYSDYQKEFIEQAQMELTSRGLKLSNEELAEIQQKKRNDILQNENDIKFRSFLFGGWQKNIVRQSDKPELFSLGLIIFLSTLFTGLVGGCMFIYNLIKLNQKRFVFYALLFSTLWTFIVLSSYFILFKSEIHHQRSTVRSFVGLDFLISNVLFVNLWWKFIGGQTLYRAKKVDPVLIFLFVITFICLILKF